MDGDDQADDRQRRGDGDDDKREDKDSGVHTQMVARARSRRRCFRLRLRQGLIDKGLIFSPELGFGDFMGRRYPIESVFADDDGEAASSALRLRSSHSARARNRFEQGRRNCSARTS
jgi:hypothetical protein